MMKKMKKVTQRVAAITAMAASIAVPYGIASASDVQTPIGDTYHDRAGQHAYFDNAHCGVLAGDPVVVTLNDRRYLQATSKVACEGASVEAVSSQFERLGSNTLFNGAVSLSSSATASPGTTTEGTTHTTVVLRRLCRNYATTSYASHLQVTVRSVQGDRQALVFDFSRFNGRSCGF